MKNKIVNREITKKMKDFFIGYVYVDKKSKSVKDDFFMKNSETVLKMKKLGFFNGNGAINPIIESMNDEETSRMMDAINHRRN